MNRVGFTGDFSFPAPPDRLWAVIEQFDLFESWWSWLHALTDALALDGYPVPGSTAFSLWLTLPASGPLTRLPMVSSGDLAVARAHRATARRPAGISRGQGAEPAAMIPAGQRRRTRQDLVSGIVGALPAFAQDEMGTGSMDAVPDSSRRRGPRLW